MGHKRLCSHTLETTLNYISERLWGLKGKANYPPNSKSTHDLIEDGDQLSGTPAA